MAWQELALNRLRPSQFTGIAFTDWVRLLRGNRFAIPPSYWFRAALITCNSVLISVLRQYERFRFDSKLKDVAIHPPLFVLGHWRHGTTHLHNLLAMDHRFAYPTLFQVAYPHTFLVTEKLLGLIFGWFLPPTRPGDNVIERITDPAEDERALCNCTQLSPYVSFAFPAAKDLYDTYLTFQGVPEEAVMRWKSAMNLFLKKLTWKYQRPLVLKSPTHTCRIRLLLEAFPKAKFVHIHRNPFSVFQSTRHTMDIVLRDWGLQDPQAGVDDWILSRYANMYSAFFDERGLIPTGQFHEVAFEELEKDPLATLQKLYSALGLPEFEEVRPIFQSRTQARSAYQKNAFPELPDALRGRVATEWERSFKEWGYDC